MKAQCKTPKPSIHCYSLLFCTKHYKSMLCGAASTSFAMIFEQQFSTAAMVEEVTACLLCYNYVQFCMQ